MEATGGPSRTFKERKRKKKTPENKKLAQIDVERIPQHTGSGEVICLAFMRGLNSIDIPFPSIKVYCRTIAGHTTGQQQSGWCDESKNLTDLVAHSFAFPGDVNKKKESFIVN